MRIAVPKEGIKICDSILKKNYLSVCTVSSLQHVESLDATCRLLVVACGI